MVSYMVRATYGENVIFFHMESTDWKEVYLKAHQESARIFAQASKNFYTKATTGLARMPHIVMWPAKKESA